MITWDEKFRMKCLEESKGILCDDFKTGIFRHYFQHNSKS